VKVCVSGSVIRGSLGLPVVFTESKLFFHSDTLDGHRDRDFDNLAIYLFLCNTFYSYFSPICCVFGPGE
jgi:hypothetical protein